MACECWLAAFACIVIGLPYLPRVRAIDGLTLHLTLTQDLPLVPVFLVAGFLIRRTGTPLMSRMHGGVEKVAPVLAGSFLIAGLATCGLPGLSPFVSEILVLIAAFQHHWWTGAIAVSAIVLTAFYILWMYQRTMTGPDLVGGREAQTRDLDRREVGTLAPLFVALIVFGFFPMPLLNVINPYVDDTLQHVGVHDPAPTVAAAPVQGGQQ